MLAVCGTCVVTALVNLLGDNFNPRGPLFVFLSLIPSRWQTGGPPQSCLPFRSVGRGMSLSSDSGAEWFQSRLSIPIEVSVPLKTESPAPSLPPAPEMRRK